MSFSFWKSSQNLNQNLAYLRYRNICFVVYSRIKEEPLVSQAASRINAEMKVNSASTMSPLN